LQQRRSPARHAGYTFHMMDNKIPPPSAQKNAVQEGKEKLRRTVEFIIDGEEKSFDRDTFMQDMGVVDIVRIQPGDFPKINPTPGWRYTHFNFEKTVNKPGKKYLIARIEKTFGKERDPRLSLEGALIAGCVDSQEKLSYDDLTDEQLNLSLEGMKTRSTLEDEMVNRYGPSRGLDRAAVLAAGLGCTFFEIEKPAPAVTTAPLE
jgi:hypothetical protein